jgi:predicted PhzF superfamily epimerase YddE/YHI9
MKSNSIYIVNAFSSKSFEGNPAAVVPLESWLPDETMQAIATQNNLSETVFFIKNPNQPHYDIRWFSPKVEIDLCGHATLASAYVLFEYLGYAQPSVIFESKSGKLEVFKKGEHLFLDFPASFVSEVEIGEELSSCFNKSPQAVFKAADDYLLRFHSQADIEQLLPDFEKLKQLGGRGFIVTAPSLEAKFDFVSRFFAPNVGVNEDPVTGSAHTKLIPFWANELNKSKMNAKQLSDRKGYLICENLARRVLIGGQANLFLKGEIWF